MRNGTTATTLGLRAHHPGDLRFGECCVVIPAYNEELLIGRCIESVIAAGISGRHIYVVDDQSTDATASVVARYQDVTLLRNTARLGKLGGLQRVIRDCDLVARYRYLSLLDADSHVSRTYFEDVAASFASDSEIVLVCGAPESERHNWLTAYRALEYAITLRIFRKAQHAMRVITVAPGCASTYRTSILGELDFDGHTLVEDMDLTVQIYRKGLGRVAFAPSAIAYTQDPRTLRAYIGQITRWYSGTWQVMVRHRLPFRRQRIDLEFALLNGEGLIYALVLLAQPVVLWLRPAFVWQMFLLDQTVWFALSLAMAVLARRADIVMAFPFFLLVRCINCGVLLHTFWREIVCRKRRAEWFTVARYRAASASDVEMLNA